jgi:molybdopterin molybdotransferase
MLHPMNHEPVIEVGEALKRIGDVLGAVPGEEEVALEDALGRFLIEPLHANLNVPERATAAMDGYALRAADAAGKKPPFALENIGTVLAGHSPGRALSSGQCVRIMTGALLPDGADSVVMIEDTALADGTVIIASRVLPGSHVRLAGEQLALGDVALDAGRALAPADLQVAAMLGHASLKVRRRPRVAVFSSGDEVQPLGTNLKQGAVYDSNRQFLLAALSSIGVDILDLGIVRDERALISRAIDTAAASADVLITTGGASRGDADHVSRLLQERGTTVFAGVAMKPGRPSRLTLCSRGEPAPLEVAQQSEVLPVFALPGSPAAMLTAFYVLVAPGLALLSGAGRFSSRRIKARLEGSLDASRGRTTYIAARLEFGDQGALARPSGKTRPVLPGARLEAGLDGLIELSEQHGARQHGDSVTVLLV